MLDLQRRGYTILLIDHNFEHVSSICSRGFLLVGGKLSRSGTIDELLHDDLVIQQYVGV
jgi:branched-chain amino acid transport system ATP-binding protein